MHNYTIRFGEYDTLLLDAVVELFTQSFYWTNKFTQEYLDWQYLQNPQGSVVSFNAFDKDGCLAAHYATIPIQMVLGGKCERGLLSLNTATHPNHQGRHLFTELASKTYQYAQEHGFKFVIGVANANSTSGFLKHLGFELICPLEFKVGIGDIFRKVDNTSMNRVFYDHDTLLWRLKCPAFKYSALDDCLFSNRKEPLFHSIIGKIPNKETRHSLGLPRPFDLFNIYVGLGVNPKSGVYFSLPKWIKRSPFNLIFKDLSGGELPKLTKDNVFFQLLDFDVA